MPVNIILAHGALGRFDEVIFLSAVAIFIGLMGIAWVKSRNTLPEFDETEEPNKSGAVSETEAPDRFQLD